MTELSQDDLLKFADRVKGKVVLITGAGSGIGKDAALKFAQYGAKLSVHDINEESAAATAEEIVKAGGEAISFKSDITDWDQQLAAFEATLAKFGSVDVVVANAGIAESDRLQNVNVVNGKPQKPALQTVQVNLIGNVYTVQLAQHYLMQGAKGDLKAIVVISSLAAFDSPAAPSYAVAKSGLVGLVRGLSPFLAKEGIRISLLHPWFADTPIIKMALPILEGLPLTPVDLISKTIIRGATDPDLTTTACGYILPDDKEVHQVEKAAQIKAVHPSLMNSIHLEVWKRFATYFGWTVY